MAKKLKMERNWLFVCVSHLHNIHSKSKLGFYILYDLHLVNELVQGRVCHHGVSLHNSTTLMNGL